MEKRRRLPRRWYVVGANFSVLTLNYADRSAIAVAGPLMVADLGLSTSTFGWILSAFFLGYVPGVYLGGWAADRFGPRSVMAWAITGWSFFTALTAAGFNAIFLMAVRFLFGIAEGPQAPSTTKSLSNWFPRRNLATGIGFTYAAQPLGGAIGGPVTVAIIAAFDGSWRAPFIAFGLMGVLFLIGWWVVVRDTPGKDPRALPSEVEEMRRDEAEQRAAEESAGVVGKENVRKHLLNPQVLTVMFGLFGVIWLLYTFLNWFPLYVTQQHGVDLGGLAVATAVPWFCGALGMASSGLLADWVAKRTGGRIFLARKWTFIVTVLIVGVLLMLVGITTTATAAVVLMAAVLFVLYIPLGLPQSLIASLVPKSVFGSVFGFVLGTGNLAGIFSPVVIGYIVDGTGNWMLVFGIGAAIAVVPALVLAMQRTPAHLA
ncbi:MFS transporter [Prauserella cavernicola]|uniref:MFS transporter n=1 Tax=Prauserella cavernicola TaxID=2800127 RepID=A0A934QXE9_9PSEU|nr:MFS transporter [Prauserella cavernicola]MBK1787294.1 MFS transporter [Prauserella cavernicola]